MIPRHLLGPVSPEFADQHIDALRSEHCRTFALRGRADLMLSWHDSWEAALSRLPAGWNPQFVAVWVSYTALPPWLFTCPLPIIALAADWNALWSGYRHVLPLFDRVLTDGPGAALMKRAGLDHVHEAPLFGLERRFLEPLSPADRDIDVLFVGNLHPAVQGERLPWLARLASMVDEYRIRIDCGVFGAEYLGLLRRAKIVFNRSVRGECNKRAFEAPACGAVLFQEETNQEVCRWLAPERHFVPYGDENLEQLIQYILTHDDERFRIANAAQQQVQRYGFDQLWLTICEEIERDIEPLRERAHVRVAGDGPTLVCRTALDQTASHGRDVTLRQTLADAVRATPSDPHLAYLYGLASGDCAAFERAMNLDSGHHLARLGFARSRQRSCREREAAQIAAEGIEKLERGQWPAGLAELPPPGTEFDWLRQSWERAGFEHVGDLDREQRAKQGVLRREFLLILGESAHDPGALYEARLQDPRSPVAAAALGRALAQSGRFTAAARHLQHALDLLPFDSRLARDLWNVQRSRNDVSSIDTLVSQRQVLAFASPGHVAWEDWFTPEIPGAGALVSIIVLCCDEVDLSRACLESIVRSSQGPYELILVDNGSTDQTPALLATAKAWTGPKNVIVIRNSTNLGFAAGVNRGLAAAQGEWVCLLNNDTQVFPGWLGGLLAAASASGPRAGLIGPVSNYAAPPQLVSDAPSDPVGRMAYAEQLLASTPAHVDVPRLTGFCLLVRATVWKQLGGLDERFGPGFFEDDDLCMRARRAGWKLVLTRNVFVHHEGSRTFKSLGLDAPSLLRENLGRFRGKWGDAAASGYLDPQLPTPKNATGRRNVSLTMIVRNEEANIRDCLLSIRDLVDEIIVVDTGSTDRTRQIAHELGANVIEFPWIDDFAAARNEALRHATGDWVIWMDADDRLDELNRRKLRSVLESLPNAPAAFVIKCECVRGPASSATVVDHVRLFSLDARVRWQHRVHEQILPSLRSIGATVHWTDVVVHHFGYLDPSVRSRKLDRDLRLLHLELQELPDHPFTHFNLGMVFLERKDPLRALTHLRHSLSNSAPGDSITRKLFALIVQCLRSLNRLTEALDVVREGRQLFPDDAELTYCDAQLRLQFGDPASAEQLARLLCEAREANRFGSVDAELRGSKAKQVIATACFLQGRTREAEQTWREILLDEPGDRPACLGLAELLILQGRFGELEDILQRLDPAAPETIALRARLNR